MSGAPDEQDKSHDPTPSRIDRARREGDVAQSKEVAAAAQHIALYGAVIFYSGAAAIETAKALRLFLQRPDDFTLLAFRSEGPGAVAAALARPMLAAAPFIGAPMAAAALALIAQRAVTFVPGKLAPRLSRISIIANARQKFGPRGLGEFARGLIKLGAVMGLAALAFASRFGEMPAAAQLPAAALGALLQQEAALFLGLIALFFAALAAIDLPLAQISHLKKLRMSMEELKRESKENDGDPHFKFFRREKARSFVVNRMMLDVPKASVVIVNPEHYAVALSWSRESKRAPVCTAKGVDHLAAKIRELAAANGVPIRRDPATARAIHATVKVGREIDRAHYAAVATAIHFAEAIERRRKLK
ncbi:MAG: EscU/YscU/HrcU family type III secretion system export apparatus switch protein [Parvularculaceae bacterium]